MAGEIRWRGGKIASIGGGKKHLKGWQDNLLEVKLGNSLKKGIERNLEGRKVKSEREGNRTIPWLATELVRGCPLREFGWMWRCVKEIWRGGRRCRKVGRPVGELRGRPVVGRRPENLKVVEEGKPNLKGGSRVGNWSKNLRDGKRNWMEAMRGEKI